MFRVTDVDYIPPGIRAVLVMDDPADLLYLQFLRNAERFAVEFHHKVKTRKRCTDRALEQPVRDAQLRAERGRLLAAFKLLPGSRVERIRSLHLSAITRGERASIEGISTLLRIAVREEREILARRTVELAGKGRSVREISSFLSIPRSTVGRFLTDARGCPTIDDLPTPATTPRPETRSELLPHERTTP